ncbi:MAG: phage tail protein [Pyrinomonadaceae bacterium]
MINSYLLELDGKPAGRFQSLEGGGVATELIPAPFKGTMKITRPMSFRNIVMKFGAGMSREFYRWISDSLKKNYTRLSGSIVRLDALNKEVGRIEFVDGILTSLKLSPLKAGSTEDLIFRAEIAIEKYAMSKTPLSKSNLGIYTAASAKPLNKGNFKVDIADLDTGSVSAVSDLVYSQIIKEFHNGDDPLSRKMPQGSRYSNVTITLPKDRGDSFLKWHQKSVIDHSRTMPMEKSGSIELLGTDKKSLFEIELHELGIISASFKGNDMVVEMYCDSFLLTDVGAGM